MIDMDVKSKGSSLIIGVRGNVLVAGPGESGLFDFITQSSSFTGDGIVGFDEFFSHFVHVVAVDFCVMCRDSVLQCVDGSGVQTVF